MSNYRKARFTSRDGSTIGVVLKDESNPTAMFVREVFRRFPELRHLEMELSPEFNNFHAASDHEFEEHEEQNQRISAQSLFGDLGDVL